MSGIRAGAIGRGHVAKTLDQPVCTAVAIADLSSEATAYAARTIRRCSFQPPRFILHASALAVACDPDLD
jgi:hypothetical protein